MPRKISIRRLYRTLARSACSSVNAWAAIISGVESGILIAIKSSRGTIRLAFPSRNRYFAWSRGLDDPLFLSGRGPNNFGGHLLAITKRIDQVTKILR